jgi:ABC-2 type transport system permease protein
MLFRRELSRNLRSFIVITAICATLIVYIISMAPSFGKDIQQILDFKLSKNLQAAFGMKDLDYSKPDSFFALGFSYVYLFISVYIAGVFATIVSKEFSEKTAEYLFSLPSKRINIIITKISVAIIYLLLSVIILFLSAWISLSVFIKGSYDLKPVLMMSLAWLIGGLTFGSITFMASSFFTKARTISSLSVGIVMLMYMMQIVISVNDKMRFLKYISPFDWFKGSEIGKTGELPLEYCFIAVAVIFVCIITGIRRFKKMDVLI